LFTEKTPVAQALQPVVLAIVFGNHLQAGGTTVHGVKLVGEGERHYNFTVFTVHYYLS
jgi:hypothetical protein